MKDQQSTPVTLATHRAQISIQAHCTCQGRLRLSTENT